MIPCNLHYEYVYTKYRIDTYYSQHNSCWCKCRLWRSKCCKLQSANRSIQLLPGMPRIIHGCKWLLAQLAICHERHAKGWVETQRNTYWAKWSIGGGRSCCMPSKRPDSAKSHGASVFSLVFVLSPPRDAVSLNCTVGFFNQILIRSWSLTSYFVRLSACINPVGTQWIWLGAKTCCTLLTLINDLFSDSDGFSATSESYKDLASTMCTIWSVMLPL